jgi:small subunit ribosomal protein S16
VAVKLRLMRMGKKKQPTYRIVASDSRSPRDGRFIEVVGTYAPRSDPSVIEVDNARAVRWLAQGAQPTDTVRKLLGISGAWGEFETHRASGAPVPPRVPKRKAVATAVATPAKAGKPAAPKPAAEKPAAEKPTAEAPATAVEAPPAEEAEAVAEAPAEAVAEAPAEAEAEQDAAAGDPPAGED